MPTAQRMFGSDTGSRRTRRLTEEIDAFYKRNLPSTDEHKMRQIILNRITEAIVKWISDASISSFASSAKGTGAPTADIDANILLSREETVGEEHYKNLTIGRVILLHFITVPVVQFQLIPELGGLKVDLTMQRKDGLRSTALVAQLIHEMPKLAPLTVVIKRLLAKAGLRSGQGGGMGGFNTTMLVAFVLQREGHHFYLGELLLKVLDFVSRFNASDYAINLRTKGQLVPRTDKNSNCLCIENLNNSEISSARRVTRLKKVAWTTWCKSPQATKTIYFAPAKVTSDDSRDTINILGHQVSSVRVMADLASTSSAACVPNPYKARSLISPQAHQVCGADSTTRDDRLADPSLFSFSS
ncbi:hypothetical protein CF326_g8489 [Tilletia indica]|nr:hypothetical protein CF326_g8489 [Tilletia indica]